MFDLVIAVDWSAASTAGPKRETKDRCWLAWATANVRSEAEYFRTRSACMKRIAGLARSCTGKAVIGFDFPFGYPAGSGLMGGRQAARIISDFLITEEDDSNNRFEAASRLNAELFDFPGPFWGCPKNRESIYLSANKPASHSLPFNEWRIVENHLRTAKKQYSISSVWKLAYPGSVGSQSLTGLTSLLDLAKQADIKDKTRFWPFETNWEKDLNGIILTEIWPSLNAHETYDHNIRDARQVLASRDWILDHMAAGTARALFAAPDWLTAKEKEQCAKEEGWILGVS